MQILTRLALAAGAFLAAALAQAADAFPSKPVTLVTAFAPGSGPDATLRLVAERLGRAWGQRVIVENRPGGGGLIAMDTVRRAAPDGHTLLQLDSEHLAAVPHLYRQRGAAALAGFEPVAALFRTGFLVAVPADSKFRSLGDIVAAAKAAPGRVSYGSWGVGSPGHLGGELLELQTGITMTHVPYREVSQLFGSVGAGDVQWSLATLPSSSGAYKAGKLRYVAVASSRRLPQLPEVPTAAEAGGPKDFAADSFVVLVAPKGIEPAVAARIHADVAKAVADPQVRERFDTFAFEPIAWSPQEIAAQAAAKARLYGALVQKASISLE